MVAGGGDQEGDRDPQQDRQRRNQLFRGPRRRKCERRSGDNARAIAMPANRAGRTGVIGNGGRRPPCRPPRQRPVAPFTGILCERLHHRPPDRPHPATAARRKRKDNSSPANARAALPSQADRSVQLACLTAKLSRPGKQGNADVTTAIESLTGCGEIPPTLAPTPAVDDNYCAPRVNKATVILIP